MAHIATASVMNADDYHLFYCSHINKQPFALTPPANLDLSMSLDCGRKLRTYRKLVELFSNVHTHFHILQSC